MDTAGAEGARPLYNKKRLLRLFWPVLAEQTLATLTGVISTIMVSGVSPEAVAAVGLVNTVNFLVMNAFTAVATGVTVVVSHMIGAGEHREAGKISAQALVLVFYISAALGALLLIFDRPILLFLFGQAEPSVIQEARIFMWFSASSLPLLAIFSTIAGVMRASGNARTPLWGALLNNIAYVALAAGLIFGRGLGVAGAGWALCAGRLACAGFLSFFLFKGMGGVYLPRLKPQVSLSTLKSTLRIAIPAGVDSVLFNGGKMLVQVFLSGMGTATLSAYAISNSISSFIIMPGLAVSILSVTVVGQHYGAGMYKEARAYMGRLTLWATAANGILCLLIWPVIGFCINLFSPMPESYELAYLCMILHLIATPILWGASFALPTMLRATGAVQYTMWVSVTSMILLRVLGSWFLGVYLGMNLLGVWLAMFADWLARAAFFVPKAYKPLTPPAAHATMGKNTEKVL